MKQEAVPPSICDDHTENPPDSLQSEVACADSRLRRRVFRSRKNLSSTGWISSIALHVVAILLLTFILAPADFGGMGMHSLLIKFDRQEPQEQFAVVELGASEDPQLPEEFAPALGATLLGQLSLNGTKANAAASNQSGGPRGTFFGIEASGHEFVYVVDMSGSMRGRRFERASAELMQSINQLGPNQKFYVMLFGSETVQMFGRSDLLPQTVTATQENKERLGDWLQTAYEGGGTDPRRALQVAMRMNPAAIFMLSDGEFNKPQPQKQEDLLGGNSDVFSLVAASPTKPPIHSIAYEDAQSRENMNRLAEMTEGKFRFVDLNMEPIRHARTALEQGDLAKAELSGRDAIACLANGDGEDTFQAKLELGTVLFELAKHGLEKDELHLARLALVDYARIAPQDEMIEKLQSTLVEKLLDRMESGHDSAAEACSLLSKFATQYPNSTAAKLAHHSLARAYLDEARQLYAKGKYLESVRKLETAISTFVESAAISECRDERGRSAKKLFDQAEQLRQQKGDAAWARHVRHLASLCEGTQFHEQVTLALETQAKQMLAGVRDASYSKDLITKNRIQQQLDAGFGDDEFLIRVRQKFASQERSAEAIFRRAIRLETPSQIMNAVVLYRTLVKDFSGTLAAQMAEQRLRMLGQFQGD